MNTLILNRISSPTVTIPIDEKTLFSQKLMTEHRITSEFYSATVLDIQIGDYITHNSENFYINRLPGIIKINEKTYQYHIDFESVMYDLAKKLFISSDGLAEYGSTGTATDFITSIVVSMNEIGSGWSVGTVDTTDEKTILFSNESCRSALTRIAEAFELEFSLTGKSISLVNSVGATVVITFEYGKNNGLYKLERQQISDQNIVTKLYGFGGMTNIPDTYRTRARRLIFSTDGPYSSPPLGIGGGDRFITKNSSLYGIIEGQYTNDDIYPNRTGTITAVKQDVFVDDKYDSLQNYVEDTSINFDISTSKIDGAAGPPSIVFKSGDLSGQEFEIWKYDSTNKRIYFNPQSDEDGYTTPNPLNVAGVGDTYTLINIALPQAYIDTAEEELLTEATAYLEENCVPMVVYSVEIDPKFARTNQLTLKAGDRVTIVDTALGINALIRIASIEYPLSNIYKIKAVIADFVPYTIQERIINNAVEQKKQIVFVDRTNIELERRNVMRQSQLRDLIFDTDGYFIDGRIRPLSIETMYLSVGAKSGNFNLFAMIHPNYLGNANRIYVSTGELLHKEFSIGGQYTWVIGSSLDQASLTPTTAYYLYAKCSKTALTGEWILSSSQITVEQVTGYYHFLIGVLFVVYDSWRDFEFTYGMTYINGRIITTGRIRSVSGYNYLDLDQDEFNIGDATKGLDWNVTASGVLTIRGALVQNGGGITAPIGVFRGAYNASYTYYLGDEVTDAGSFWRWKNATPGSGHTPAEDAYWNCVATAGNGGDPGDPGSPGDYIEYQYAKNSSSSTPPSIVDTDLNPTGWSITPPSLSVLEYLWMTRGRKDYLGTSLVGTWSAPVRMTGVGTAGSTGPTGVYQGVYDNGKTYYGTSVRADIVLYSGLYYIARTDAGNGFSGHLPTDTAYWNSFGANFESVATSLLFATLAYIDNLGVKYFNGVPKPVGNLAGTVVNTQAHVAGVARQDSIELSGSSGSCYIKCNGSGWKTLNYTSDLSTTAALFVSTYYNDFYNDYGVVLSSTGSIIYFTARVVGTDFTENAAIQNTGGTLNGTRYLTSANTANTPRIDTITLSGTGGHADIICDDTASEVIFETSLSNTTSDFVINYATTYAAKGITVTNSGADIIFTENDGNNFIGTTSITNNPYCGAVKIVGNDIWEDDQASHNGEIAINQKSYAGGKDYWRRLVVGDGRGKNLVEFIGNIYGGRININADLIALFSNQLYFPNLPTNSGGLANDQIYRNGNYLMIK